MSHKLSNSDLLKLRLMNTPTIYNGWKQITKHNVALGHTNLEETIDFMPHLGSMVGYAVTLVIEPSNAGHSKGREKAVFEYRQYIASIPGPKIVMVQDLDKPNVIGSFWGEVNSNIHRSLGCVGAIIDGGVRDVDEMSMANFKTLARRMCVGNAHVTPVKWGCEVEVFGTKVQPGQLIHADQHGFIVIPAEDEKKLLKAALYMDECEFDTVIPAVSNTEGMSKDDILTDLDKAGKAFNSKVRQVFDSSGEW